MREKYTIEIPGKPIPTPRPRVARGHAYISKPARQAQEFCGRKWLEKYKTTQLTGRIEAEIQFIFEPPKSWSKKKVKEALSGNIGATSHSLGDLDNLMKTALDGLNHLAYEDDSQIVAITAIKAYGKTAQTIITLEEVNG